MGWPRAARPVVSRSSVYFDKQFLNWPKFDPAARLFPAQGGRFMPDRNAEDPDQQALHRHVRAFGDRPGDAWSRRRLQGRTRDAQLGARSSTITLEKTNFQAQSFGYSARLDPRMMYAALRLPTKTKSKWGQWDDPAAIGLCWPRT